MSLENQKSDKSDNFTGFNKLKEKKIIPIFKWDEHENVLITTLVQKVESMKIEEIEGSMGTSHFLKLPIYNEDKKESKPQMVNINSLRLRIALKKFGDEITKYPISIKITRTGEKFETQYLIEPYEIQ